ncbi:hypothetical protein N7541_004979 [Penicillium brevicompactum]|uniref:Uncharacterized protein n=1 Tax=Penicillium brevicompactum TaxID=5074 RepID=A0A9W9UWX1_PENBR|nr:hypothetical protein N7541_004979 [Penicillium brevicompactum]
MADSQSKAMPIAIIGMGCRFAGDATSPTKLWKMLENGESAWSEIPASRFDIEGWYHPNHENISTTNVRGGHFLREDLGFFDAHFFGLSTETASTMDPQYRLLLETVYESLENAGLALDRIAGSNTSVFSGAFFHDYQDGHMRDAENLPRFLMTGNGAAMASNRISHFFDFRGPSMTIDTGCSTTLTALHQACQSLRSGDADMSVVGGSNLLINPDFFVTISTLGMLSKDGKSYSFDHRANGYGRGEGVAAIILKRLDDALIAGDPIRALIRETNLNQDGKTETLTSPSCEAQQQLIRECYEKADICPSSVQYFEAHGTGTPTGDPIEASAIAALFQKGRPRDQPLFIGSVKTNLGHTEPTSGLASVIKPNKQLLLDEWNMRVPLQCTAWPIGADGVRRASVNNFGYGGANAHLILEGWQPVALHNSYGNGSSITPGNGRSKIFILSAKDEKSCKTMASNLTAYLQDHISDSKDHDLFDNLAFTLGGRRTRFPWSLTTPASSLSALATILGNDKLSPTRASARPRIGFVFTGQGAQWYAMGRGLLNAYPIFKSSILEAEGFLRGFGCKWSLLDELLRDEETTNVTDTSFGMPLCAAIQISLVRLLEAWGVTPTAVSSHSSGEIAAAYTVGALSFRSAMAACYSRCEIASELDDARGGMMAVGLNARSVQTYLDGIRGGEVNIACINSPSSVTVSGDLGAIEELETLLKEHNIFARRLRVRTAFHSHHMQPLYEPYLSSMQEIMEDETRELRPIIYSSPTTGTRITDAAQLSNPKHWADSMVQPVLFQDSFCHMALDPISGRADIDIAVEVGPHAALSGPIGDILVTPQFRDTDISYHSCLVRNQDAVANMQSLASQLVSKGYPVDINRVNFPTGVQGLSVITDLPSYPWNHEIRHWDEPRVNVSHRSRKIGYHDLLGVPVNGTNPFAPSWRHVIRLSDLPWVREHTVQSNVIYPGAGYICMAIEAVSQLAQETNQVFSGYRLRDVDILQALIIPEGPEGVEVQLNIKPVNSKAIGMRGWNEFNIFSVGRQGWTEHCRGLISTGEMSAREEWSELRHFQRIEPEDVFSALRANAIYHGRTFQNLQSVQVGNDQAVATLVIADVASTMPSNYQRTHVLHPTTLDSVFVSAYGVLLGNDSTYPSMVPKTIKNLWLSHDIQSRPGHQFESHIRLLRADRRTFASNIFLSDSADSARNPVLVIDGFICQSLGGVAGVAESNRDDICSVVMWAPDISYMDLGSLNKAIGSPANPKEGDVILDLKRACFHYIQEALSCLSSKEIQQLEWHHKRFHTWMKLQVNLALSDELASFSSAWIKDSDEEKAHLFKRVASSSVNGEAVFRLGTRLIPLLTKMISPLELLMEDKLLHKYYRGALKFDRCNVHLARIAEHLIHKNPRAKILEIGAGTGGTTLPILNAIGNGKKCGWGPYASEYHFTDISSGFFAEAQAQFADWGAIMTYRKLDIEVDPEQQDFECGSYDIVVANQVLHATKSMVATMTHVRRLLKPGGKLLLMENTKNQMDMQFVFGLLPGWWRSSDGRKMSPILSAAEWDTVLGETGFSGRDLDVHDCESEELYTMSVIMTTALQAKPEISKSPPIVLIHDPNFACLDDRMGFLQHSIAAFTAPDLVSVTSLGLVDGTGKICVFLGDHGDFSLSTLKENDFKAIVRLLTCCKALLWVTTGGVIECERPESALSLGLLRTLRRENLTKTYLTLDTETRDIPRWASAITKVLASIINSPNVPSRDFEFAERDGSILVPRLVKDFDRNRFIAKGVEGLVKYSPFLRTDPHLALKLEVDFPGLLETLTFKEIAPLEAAITPELIEIEPMAFGLNFRDVMAAMGQLNETVMGLECSGIVTRVGTAAASHGFAIGCRVIALVDGKYQNRIRIHWTAACVMPHFDFCTAASIPMAFATAYISLYDTAKICKHQSVLIHAGTGGVGQAAIILAQHLGAEVYATAGSVEKRQFITSEYGIPQSHVFSSRDPSFATELMSVTGGKGVDVVLNCLSGQLLQESFNCLAAFGHFVEIGKFDLERNNYLEMAPFTSVASFSSIDILALVRLGSPVIHRALTGVVHLLQQGLIHPVKPVKVYTIADIEKAYRQMQAGKHLGKIVLSAEDCSIEYCPIKPTARLRPDATYLITGGVGGIGRSVATWLLAHGARSLILMSRSATSGATTKSFARDLEDASPPIRGVIQAAMVLRDSIIENMGLDDYNAAILPKVQGSWNLHHHLGKDLDFFIMLSSLAGVIGNPSQSNYTAGGAFQDALARYRVSQGLPGVSLDIGAVKNVGYVASNRSVHDRLERSGYRLLEESEILSAIESAIIYPCPQIVVGINTGRGGDDTILSDARFDALRYIKAANSNNATKPSSSPHALSHQLTSVSSTEEASRVVLQALAERLVEIFLIPIEEVIDSKSMADFGVDSLVAVELRNMLAVQAGAEISIFDIMQSPSLVALAHTVAAASTFVA